MAIELANYFLTEKDEHMLSSELKAMFPSLAFIDDQLWESPTPPIQPSIADCRSGLAYLWWKDLVPTLPIVQEANNRFRGPTTGYVLQFLRCRRCVDRLQMGQMRVDTDSYSNDVAAAVRTVFKVMRRKFRGSAKVRFEDDYVYPNHLKSYLIGEDATAEAVKGVKLAIHALSYVVPNKKAEPVRGGNRR